MLTLSGKGKKHRISDHEGSFFASSICEKEKPRKKSRRSQLSLFEQLVTDAGYLISEGNQYNLLNCDQAIFQKNLKKSLLFHPSHGKADLIDEFMSSLETYMQNLVNLKWLLLYTQTAPDCTSCRGGQQDSLVRLLLNIDDLQPKLIILLTEKLLEVAYDDNEQDKLNLPRLILANLRWLDRIVNPAGITEKITDLLHGSPLEVQKEVICFLPNIVDDPHHKQVAEVMCNLYESTPALASSILDSLSYLTLDSHVLEDMYHSILKTLHVVKAQNLPIVVNFLLQHTPPNLAYEVVSEIREKICLPGEQVQGLKPSQVRPSQRRLQGGSSPNKLAITEVANTEILLFTGIQKSLLIHKHLSIVWLKTIVDIKDPESFRPFDFLMLVTIYQVVPPRHIAIEKILRNLLRQGLPAERIFARVFDKHSAVLKEYFTAIKKLADQLIRSNESNISQAGVTLYKYCFLKLDQSQQQHIVISLLAYLGDSSFVSSLSLSLLLRLAYEQTVEMAKYIFFLKGSLDVLDILSFSEAKKLLEALIHLAHSSTGDESSLRDELSILTRKQLSHSGLKFKRMGVLSVVLTLKNSVGTDPETSAENDPVTTQESNSWDEMNEAELLFHTVLESTARSPPALALFMDELATNVLRNGFHSKIEKLISNKLINDFEATFVLDGDTTSTECFPCAVSFQWNLDDTTDSELAKGIAIAVAKFVAEDLNCVKKQSGSHTILSLAPHLRLMRMVESRLNDGNLESIDALLGCGIQMPNPSVYLKFDSLSNKAQSMVLSCLFYAINWLRELVNAFVTQKDLDLKRKVALRFRKIVELQELVYKLLSQKPSYVPPPAVFDFDVPVTPLTQGNPGNNSKKDKQKSKGGKGKEGKGYKKKDESENSTVLCSGLPPTLSQKSQAFNSQGGDTFDSKSLLPYLRELHLDVFNLLFKTLCLDNELDQENPSYLFVAEAQLLVNDLNQKLDHVFESGKRRSFLHLKSTNERGIGFSHLDVFTPVEVAEEALRFVKPVCAHLETISQFFQSLLDENDGIEDAPGLFTRRTMPINQLFCSLLKTLRFFLSWSFLQNPENSHLLINFLQIMAKKLEGNSVTEMGKDALVSSAFRYVSNFSKSIICFPAAIELSLLMDFLVSFTKNEDLKVKLATIIEEFLKKEWYTYGGNCDKGSTFNRNLRLLLEVFFRCCLDPVTKIHSMAMIGLHELKSASSKDPSSDHYPTMKKTTLPTYYAQFMNTVVSGTNKLLSAIPSTSSNTKQLEVWNLAIKTFHALVEPIKHFSSSNLFRLCLKYSHLFLSLFLRRGMPLMDKCLQRNQNEVMALLKNLQLITRFLQHLCTHAKFNQDRVLVRYVPFLKKSLESILFRVKAMLALNNCQDAFWIGNLKNRDLKGKELLSQEQDDESVTGNEEEEEEENVDNDLSDVDLDEESNEAT